MQDPNIKGPYTKIIFEPYNLNSHHQLKDFLLTQGWTPTQYNYTVDAAGNRVKSSPKLTEDSFPSIKGDLGKLILHRASLKSRRDFVQNTDDPENKGLLAHLRIDGRVSADANTVGTPTHRYRHVAPVVNTPSADAIYGTHVRSLFCVEDPYKLLGADFKGVEMRIAAHYAHKYDGGKLAELVLHGDFHQEQADNVYHSSRSGGKPATYAIMYGCKPPRLVIILDIPYKKAKKILEDFWTFNEGLGKLKKQLEKICKANGGWIPGLDGRKIHIRSKHSILNALIQSTGAVLFKRWLVNVNQRIQGYNAGIVIAYHDELQVECHENHVDPVSLILQEEASRLKEIYNLNVPIDADVKVGMNWGETH